MVNTIIKRKTKKKNKNIRIDIHTHTSTYIYKHTHKQTYVKPLYNTCKVDEEVVNQYKSVSELDSFVNKLSYY